jgi:hypothetical protein
MPRHNIILLLLLEFSSSFFSLVFIPFFFFFENEVLLEFWKHILQGKGIIRKHIKELSFRVTNLEAQGYKIFLWCICNRSYRNKATKEMINPRRQNPIRITHWKQWCFTLTFQEYLANCSVVFLHASEERG